MKTQTYKIIKRKTHYSHLNVFREDGVVTQWVMKVVPISAESSTWLELGIKELK